MAHRGGLDTGTENTMTAFEHAVGLGYRYVETDVHLTADGVLVAFHDDRLDRVTDATGAIADLTWDRVRRARVAGVDPIPRFEELLAAWPDLRINIDPKDDRGRAARPRRARSRVRGRVQRPAARRAAGPMRAGIMYVDGPEGRGSLDSGLARHRTGIVRGARSAGAA